MPAAAKPERKGQNNHGPRERRFGRCAIEAGYAPLEGSVHHRQGRGGRSEREDRPLSSSAWDVAVLQMCENETDPASLRAVIGRTSGTGRLARRSVCGHRIGEACRRLARRRSSTSRRAAAAVRLTTQQKELSDLRLSGVYAHAVRRRLQELARRKRAAHLASAERARTLSLDSVNRLAQKIQRAAFQQNEWLPTPSAKGYFTRSEVSRPRTLPART